MTVTDLGFCTHDTVLYPSLAAGEHAVVKAAGGSRVRIGAVWALVEATQGQFDWTALDTTINAALAEQLEVLLLLNLPRPPWIYNIASGATNFANFSQIAANRYKPGGVGITAANAGRGVQKFEICNEVNIGAVWDNSWNGGVVVSEYVSYLQAAYTAIKTANPSAAVGFAGLAAVVDWPNAFWHRGPAQRVASGFVSDAYGLNAKNYFDFMSYHPYPLNTSFQWQPPSASHPMIYEIVGIHNVMAANSDGAKPMDATEWGFSTGDFGDQTARDYLAQEWDILHAAPYSSILRHHYIYCARDFIYPGETYSSTNREQNFGIVHQDLTPKPAYSWAQSL